MLLVIEKFGPMQVESEQGKVAGLLAQLRTTIREA